MSYLEAKKRWGEESFDLDQFKSRSANERTKMGVHLLSLKKNYIGKSSTEIFNQLGRSDGFFFPDTFPAYFIYKNYETSEAWQIVFILNYKGQVQDIILQKNNK